MKWQTTCCGAVIAVFLLVTGTARPIGVAAARTNASPATPATVRAALLPADANCDGLETVADAVHVRRIVAGLAVAAPGCLSDADGSGGATDPADALFVLRSLAGMVPLVTVLTPSSAQAGSAAFTLDVVGSGFESGAEILWDGAPLSTQLLDATHATASVTAGNIAFEGASRVSIRLPGGATSNARPFVVTPGTSAAQLIDAALLAGDITAEEALTYRLYADYHDDRLPAPYRSGVEQHEAAAAWDLFSEFDSLSPAAQQSLSPYLLPPDDPNSWFFQRQLAEAPGFSSRAGCATQPLPVDGWQTLDGPYVVVHWHNCFPADQAKAAGIQQAVNTVIWDKLTSLLGEPLPDSHANSSKTDIYLIGPGRSHTTPFGACPSSAWVELASFDPHWYSDYMVAHELTHAIQFQFTFPGGCGAQENRWLLESTAQWMQDYVYPSPGHPPYTSPIFQANSEQYAAQFFLADPSLPLTTPGDPREYGAYLLWFFLHRWAGPAGAQLVPTTFANLASSPTSAWAMRAAVNSMAGGLRDLWPRFTLANWNRFGDGSVDFYQTWDGLTSAVATTAEADVTLGASDSAVYNMDFPVRELSARYYDFAIADDVGTITIKNPNWSDADAHLQGFWQLKGSDEWKPARNSSEDWGSLEEKVFCRDLQDEAVARLVIIVSSSHIEPGVLGAYPELQADKRGCSDWSGTASVTYDSIVNTDDFSEIEHQELSANIRLKWLSGELYQLSETVGQWSANYTDLGTLGNCSGGSSGAVLLPRPFANGTHTQVVQFVEDPPNAPFAAFVILTALPTSATTYTVPCEIGSIEKQGNPGHIYGLLNVPITDTTGMRDPAPPYRMSADQKSFEGSITLTFAGESTQTITWQWNLQRERASP